MLNPELKLNLLNMVEVVLVVDVVVDVVLVVEVVVVVSSSFSSRITGLKP